MFEFVLKGDFLSFCEGRGLEGTITGNHVCQHGGLHDCMLCSHIIFLGLLEP